MSIKRPALVSITVREAGIHIPPSTNSLSEYEGLSPAEKFGNPVTRAELPTLPQRTIQLWVRIPHGNRRSYCSHLDAERGKTECNTGTCYLLLIKDRHEVVQSAGIPNEVGQDKGKGNGFRGNAWPRRWFGTGFGLPIQTPEMARRGEYIKCVERDEHKMNRWCACESSLYFGYCECSTALRDERLKPERKVWREREERVWKEEVERRRALEEEERRTHLEEERKGQLGEERKRHLEEEKKRHLEEEKKRHLEEEKKRHLEEEKKRQPTLVDKKIEEEQQRGSGSGGTGRKTTFKWRTQRRGRKEGGCFRCHSF